MLIVDYLDKYNCIENKDNNSVVIIPTNKLHSLCKYSKRKGQKKDSGIR